MSSKVEPTTARLFQDPSVGVASRVLPRFQPGLRPSKNLPAEIGAKDGVEGHFTPVLFPSFAVVLALPVPPGCVVEHTYLGRQHPGISHPRVLLHLRNGP
jgi:hypothetical protein